MPVSSPESLGYLPVATATLCPSTALDCELFIQRPNSQFVELYKGAQYPLERGDVEKLKTSGIDHLFVRLESANAYRDYLCQHVLNDASLPAAARVTALREVTRVAFQDALIANDCEQMVNVASTFGGDLASIVAERSVAFRELYNTLAHDYYTFTHVCNVSVYCTTSASGTSRSTFSINPRSSAKKNGSLSASTPPPAFARSPRERTSPGASS